MKYLSLLLATLFLISKVDGQRLNTPTLSPFTKISQEVGLTEISIEYSRPSSKGRTIFGDLVPLDEIWRTGANASTKIILTESAHIGGNPIDPGTYALYTIPGKDKWTIIIHSNTKMRSIAGDVYQTEFDLFRFEVPVHQTTPFVETFTIQFSDLTTNSCNLQIIWEHTLVKIPITVDVDKHIAQQMKEFLKDPEQIPDRTYFEAAQYYLHNDKDLNEALDWINIALTKSEHDARYGLLKAKILFKKGDLPEAMTTINNAYDWAKKANNSNYIEQTDLFRKSMLKKQ